MKVSLWNSYNAHRPHRDIINKCIALEKSKFKVTLRIHWQCAAISHKLKHKIVIICFVYTSSSCTISDKTIHWSKQIQMGYKWDTHGKVLHLFGPSSYWWGRARLGIPWMLVIVMTLVILNQNISMLCLSCVSEPMPPPLPNMFILFTFCNHAFVCASSRLIDCLFS